MNACEKEETGRRYVHFRNRDKEHFRQLSPKGWRVGRKGTEKFILGVCDKSHGSRKHKFSLFFRALRLGTKCDIQPNSSDFLFYIVIWT